MILLPLITLLQEELRDISVLKVTSPFLLGLSSPCVPRLEESCVTELIVSYFTHMGSPGVQSGAWHSIGSQ